MFAGIMAARLSSSAATTRASSAGWTRGFAKAEARVMGPQREATRSGQNRYSRQ